PRLGRLDAKDGRMLAECGVVRIGVALHVATERVVGEEVGHTVLRWQGTRFGLLTFARSTASAGRGSNIITLSLEAAESRFVQLQELARVDGHEDPRCFCTQDLASPHAPTRAD